MLRSSGRKDLERDAQNAAAAGGKVTLTMTVTPVVPGELVFFAVTGEMTGIVSE